MNKRTIWILLLLFFMLWLPSMMMVQNDRGYEVILDQEKLLKSEALENIDLTGIGRFGFMSDVSSQSIDGKSFKTIYVKGDISPFYQGSSGNVTNDYHDEGDIIISREASQKLFFTANGLGNQVLIDNKTREVSDIGSFAYLVADRKSFDAMLPTNNSMQVKRILFSKKTLEGKEVQKKDISRFLGDLGISSYTINSYREIDQQGNVMKLVAKLILLVSILIYMLLQFKKGRFSLKEDPWILAFAIYFMSQLLRMPFSELPLELINEDLVSLTHYVNQGSKLPSGLYLWLNSLMSYQMFISRLLILASGFYYLVIVTMSWLLIRKDVKNV